MTRVPSGHFSDRSVRFPQGLQVSVSRNIFDNFVDLVVPEDVQALAGWLVNSVQDLWVTLSTPAHGNDGGIRILPEKLHVRYDAGNNYYAFNLELMASDFVIGV